MRLIFITATVWLALSGATKAQDFEAGLDAARAGDYATALAEWRPLAEQGKAYAQFNLGAMYANGTGVPQDDAEAVRLYRAAAEQGFDYAQFALGSMYDNGKGVQQDYAEAVRWYRLAAEQGFGYAQFMLGYKYANGEGVRQDYAQAAKWYRAAAEQGDADAQFNLGILLIKGGPGLLRNDAAAVRWFRLAAEQGDADAQAELGKMFRDGLGVPRDEMRAHMWLNISLANGNESAGSLLETVARRMASTDVSIAVQRARTCMESNYTDCLH